MDGVLYLLELAPQICEIICMGRLLGRLNHDLLIGLRDLLTYDLDVVVSITDVVPDFAPSNRISDSEIEALVPAEKNVCHFDCDDRAVPDAVGERLLIPV